MVEPAACARLDLPASGAGSQERDAKAAEPGARILRQVQARDRKDPSRLEERDRRRQSQASNRDATWPTLAEGTVGGFRFAQLGQGVQYQSFALAMTRTKKRYCVCLRVVIENYLLHIEMSTKLRIARLRFASMAAAEVG